MHLFHINFNISYVTIKAIDHKLITWKRQIIRTKGLRSIMRLNCHQTIQKANFVVEVKVRFLSVYVDMRQFFMQHTHVPQDTCYLRPKVLDWIKRNSCSNPNMNRVYQKRFGLQLQKFREVNKFFRFRMIDTLLCTEGAIGQTSLNNALCKLRTLQ